MDGTDITPQADLPSDPDEKESSAQLQIDITDLGEVSFTCNVSIAVPGDPLTSANSSLTVTIIGEGRKCNYCYWGWGKGMGGVRDGRGEGVCVYDLFFPFH